MHQSYLPLRCAWWYHKQAYLDRLCYHKQCDPTPVVTVMWLCSPALDPGCPRVILLWLRKAGGSGAMITRREIGLHIRISESCRCCCCCCCWFFFFNLQMASHCCTCCISKDLHAVPKLFAPIFGLFSFHWQRTIGFSKFSRHYCWRAANESFMSEFRAISRKKMKVLIPKNTSCGSWN